MKKEMLEALLIDQRLGELPPEVACLLEAYLARDETAAQHATKVNDALALARRSLAARPIRSLPQFKAVARTIGWRDRWRAVAVFRGPIWHMTLTMMFGLVVGYFVADRSGSGDAPLAQQAPAVFDTVARNVPIRTADNVNFWSRSHWIRPSAQAASESGRLAWHSPLRKPQIKPTIP